MKEKKGHPRDNTRGDGLPEGVYIDIYNNIVDMRKMLEREIRELGTISGKRIA